MLRTSKGISGTLSAAVALFALVVSTRALVAETFHVDVSGDEFTLYTDPNTGNQIKLGGFSGLYPVPDDDSGTLFYVVNDRGPGGDFLDGNFFAVPDYSPTIITVELEAGGTARIVDVLPLKKPNGAPILGLPNPCVPHESPLVDLSQNDISDLRDPDNLDPEGITVDRAGNFWLCEEFRPSLAMVAPDGTVVLRLVPKGRLCGGEVVPTFDILPGILGARITNRGFEDLAVTRSGMLFAIMQSPLANPGRSQRDTSRNLRLLRIDLRGLLGGHGKRAMRQFIYVTEPAPAGLRQRNVTISSLFSVTPSRFVSAERGTDAVFLFNVARATDITPFETEGGVLRSDPTRTIEQLSPAELAGLGIRTVAKTMIVPRTTDLDPFLGKVEGIAIVGSTLVLTNDNDFNLDESANFDTVPATLDFQDPPNLPRIVTAPSPIVVEDDDDDDDNDDDD